MLPNSRITTKNNLKELFYKLGLSHTSDVMVHSSMSTLGYVVNGAIDVIDALIEVVGNGTILMPAHTGQLSHPENWSNPEIPKKYLEVIKKNMNIFDKALTPVRARGIIASTFLNYPEVKRSCHPLNSVSALGKNSFYYTSTHDFDEPEGVDSPIGKLYSNNGKVLLLGVGLDSCTAIHLAEYIADVDYLYYNNPSVLKGNLNDVNKFATIKKYPGTSEFFNKYINELNEKDFIKQERFGSGVSIMFEIKPVIDFFVSKLNIDQHCLIKL
ncbi:AAC(3) family N-acetyltransferase [Candidatus Thioglobus sp.]|nr:AAC(3) family N-acetyltransferase [Candidatus Thioglobus sp.]